MAVIWDKKGIFFTFAAIVLSIVIIFSLDVYTGYRLKEKMEVTEIRIDTMNNFIKNLENDIGNAIFISGFRSLLSMEDYLMANNDAANPPHFLDDLGTDLDTAFSEAFLKGTITGTSGTERMSIMDNNTFLNWTERMKVEANKIGIELEFTVDEGDVDIDQSGPWTVEITVRLDIDAVDKNSIALWDINNKEYTATINITSEYKDGMGKNKFVDPLYLVNTDGTANNTIRETPYSNWPADLSNHLNGYFYRENSDAPNYLDRFEDSNSGTYGIESIVKRLKDKGLLDNTRSAIDHIHFPTSVASPPSCSVVDIADTDFKLDRSDTPSTTHVGFYGTSCI
ncbi:MAG: hypothetical protein V1831_01030 [Candidatus Woesearchaeota archaeon]